MLLDKFESNKDPQKSENYVISPVLLESSELEDRIKVCKSIKDFENILNETFKVDKIKKKLICITCSNSTKPSDKECSHDVLGIFSLEGVEEEKMTSKSRRLRNLQSNLSSHIKSLSHQKNIIENEKSEKLIQSKARATKEIGLKLGSLAYFWFYNKMPYRLFENFLPWFALNKIDIGQVNHSERFIRQLLNPCYSELLKRLRIHLDCVLDCTGDKRPISLIADKGTIKRDSLQMTLIRTPSLKNGFLFETFFIGNPLALRSDGIYLTNLLITEICTLLNWSTADLRKQICGGCFDGQYLHNNVPRHISDKLDLPLSFLQESVIHDPAHRIELVANDVKNGKINRNGEIKIPATTWLIELDNVLQHIMIKFNYGINHTQLINIAKEFGQDFLQFSLFSDTRFYQYAWRTYNHFAKMFHILFEKIK